MSTKAGGAELPSYLKIIKQLDAQIFDFEMEEISVALWHCGSPFPNFGEHISLAQKREKVLLQTFFSHCFAYCDLSAHVSSC